MEYLIRKCSVHGDGRWIYEHIKREANAPTVMSHSRLVGNFVNQRRDATNLNAARLRLNEDADHVEAISRAVGMKKFTLPYQIRRSLLMDIALSYDPTGCRRKKQQLMKQQQSRTPSLRTR